MKRVKSACICQTLHFLLKEDAPLQYAQRLVDDEVESYKLQLQKNKIRHKIVGEEKQPDGSVVIKVIKQYAGSPVGEYLD